MNFSSWFVVRARARKCVFYMRYFDVVPVKHMYLQHNLELYTCQHKADFKLMHHQFP